MNTTTSRRDLAAERDAAEGLARLTQWLRSTDSDDVAQVAEATDAWYASRPDDVDTYPITVRYGTEYDPETGTCPHGA